MIYTPTLTRTASEGILANFLAGGSGQYFVPQMASGPVKNRLARFRASPPLKS